MTTKDTASRTAGLPNSYVIAEYGQTLFRIIALVVSVFVFATSTTPWPGPWGLLLVVPILLGLLISPIYERATFRLRFGPAGLTISTGLFTVRNRTVEWRSVGAIDVTSPWAFRIFGLSKVALSQGGDESTRFTIPAVNGELLEFIQAAWEAGRPSGSATSELAKTGAEDAAAESSSAELAPATSGPAHVHGTEPLEGDILYRASLTDLLIASVVYGQFAVAGAAVVMTVIDVLDTLGLLDLEGADMPPWPVLLAIVLAVIIALGLVATAIRLHGFLVTSHPSGIALRYGLVEKQERRIDAASISGRVVKRNLIESLIGRVRLSLLTRDSAGGLGSNLVLPSLPHAVVAKVEREAFAHEGHSRYSRIARPVAALRSLVAIVLVIGPPVALFAWSLGNDALPFLVDVLVSAALLGVLNAIGWLCTARVSTSADANTFTVTSAFISEREWVIESSTIHVISEMRLGSKPLLVRIHFYAGQARSFWFVRFSKTDIEALAQHVIRGARQAARELREVSAQV